MNKLIRKSSFLFIFLVFLLSSCATLGGRPQFSVEDEERLYPLSSYVPDDFDWQEVRDEKGEVVPGLWRFDFENKSFPIRYHAVRIDLEKSGLEVVCFPNREFVEGVITGAGGSTEDRGTTGDRTTTEAGVPVPFIYRGVTTQSFAKKNDCVVTVNLSPFAGKSGKWDLAAHLSAVRQIVGVHIDDGFVIAPPVSSYAALMINRTETGLRAEVLDSQSDAALKACDYAFGGFYVVLRDGQVRRDFVRRFDSRSGAGLSADGRTLYILVVEGERLSKSLGLSYPQCAEIFKAMGCDDALELDGGGSSELCINGKSVMSYKVSRVQANCFGFCVK